MIIAAGTLSQAYLESCMFFFFCISVLNSVNITKWIQLFPNSQQVKQDGKA